MNFSTSDRKLSYYISLFLWKVSSEVWGSLLATKVKNSEQKELHFKIANSEKAHDLGVIIDKSFREQVRTLMSL